MKLAIVCDDLIQFGGQEKLVETISDIWPDAPIYTTVVSDKWRKILNNKKRKFFTSFMQRLPLVQKIYRYYFPLLFHTIALERFDFSEYGIVLSVSSRYAHRIITKPTTKHICYMNSPGRMFWETADYFEHENYGKLKLFKKYAMSFLSLPLNYSRMVDYAAANRVDYFISNAKTPQKRIKKYYGRDSTVIYPFVDLEDFKNVNTWAGDYFVVLTRLSSWKRVDIAIQACKETGTALKIIGKGPDIQRLKKLAGDDSLIRHKIEFFDDADDEQKIEILAGSKGLIMTQAEDFGIAPLEAMALGKPVLAYGKGGVLETVAKNETGVFFDEQTSESLKKGLEIFEIVKFDEQKCEERAEKFSKKRFINELSEFIEKA